MNNELNTRNKDMDTLISLHNRRVISDSAFTEAVKKLNEKAFPANLDLDVHDGDVPFMPSPLVDKPFIQSTIGKWTAKDSPYKATFTPTQHDDKIQGLYTPDPYSGSILKPEQDSITKNYLDGILKKEEYDTSWCRKEDYPFIFSHDCTWCGESVRSDEYHDCKMGLLNKKPIELDVVVYSENRTHVPEHARSLLEKLDEVWAKRVDDYNNSKDDWERTVVKDEDGNEVVEWKAKLVTLKNPPTDVVVEGDDADINGLRHIFRLDIGEGGC